MSPAKSQKQYRFMQLIAHSPGKAKELGVSQSVAKEFVGKTSSEKRKRFAKKGMSNYK